jgi:nucleotide-binding universal stress UspA family protein
VWFAGPATGLPGLGRRSEEILQEQATRALSEAAAAAAEVAPDAEIDQTVSSGFAIAVLVAESRRAGLLVVGGGGLGRLASLLTGSVAIGVATHAECPVVVVRGLRNGAEQDASAPVVVGVDASPNGEAAIAFAFEAASARRAPMIAVHTWGYPPGDVRTAPMWDDVRAEAERELAERVGRWGEKYPDVQVQSSVTHSQPARRLIELSEHAQLVVVGSRGHGELTGLVLGSVSNAVVHRASCPVVVVRPPRA